MDVNTACVIAVVMAQEQNLIKDSSWLFALTKCPYVLEEGSTCDSRRQYPITLSIDAGMIEAVAVICPILKQWAV